MSYEATARLHRSGRKKLESFIKKRGATVKVTDCFESFSEPLVTLNGHPTTLEAVVAPISHDLIPGQTWLHDTNPLID